MVAVAVFLLTFYVISQVFEIKMDASLGSLFGKFYTLPSFIPFVLFCLFHVFFFFSMNFMLCKKFF